MRPNSAIGFCWRAFSILEHFMDMTAVQRAVVALGYSLAVDGVAGPKTKAAVAAFQRGRRLAADGIVEPLI